MPKDKIFPMYYSEYSSTDDLPIVPFSEDNWIIRSQTVTFLHCHNCLEITYCRKGDLYFLIERTENRMHEGDICVICQNTMHFSYVKGGEPAYCNYLYIDLNKFKELYPLQIEGLDYLKYHSAEFTSVISEPSCRELLMLIFKELKEQRLNYRTNVLVLTGMMLTEILRAQKMPVAKLPAASNGRFLIADSIDYMNEHYNLDITTENLAEMCHLSLTHYRRIFKNIMGLPPMMYLNRIRVEHACEMLFSTNETVLNISETVGFKTISSMNRNFKAFTGYAPLNWRNQTRRGR